MWKLLTGHQRSDKDYFLKTGILCEIKTITNTYRCLPCIRTLTASSVIRNTLGTSNLFTLWNFFRDIASQDAVKHLHFYACRGRQQL